MPLRLPHQEFTAGNMSTGSFRFIDYTPASSTGAAYVTLRQVAAGILPHATLAHPCASVAAGILPHATLAHPCASNTVSTPPSTQATLSVTGQLKPAINHLARNLRSLTATG